MCVIFLAWNAIFSNDVSDAFAIIQSQTFWIALGTLGTLSSLFFIYRQIKTSKLIAAADFLLKLEEFFYSDRMLESRVNLSQVILRDRRDFDAINKATYVLEFFDDVGLLVKKKVIPPEFAWSAYCYWVLRYWTATEGYIQWIWETEKDDTYYDGFKSLYEESLKIEKSKRKKKEITITDEQIKEFAEEEMQLRGS
jgi:hypothetical protein